MGHRPGPPPSALPAWTSSCGRPPTAIAPRSNSSPRPTPGEQLASAVTPGTAIEGVTAILLLTDEDDYNALAATSLAGGSGTPVYRLAPSPGVAAPDIAGEPLFVPTLTRPALTARYTAGARITTQPSDGGIPRPPSCCS